MTIKQELQKLKKMDIWSLMLFVLYNFQKIPEYSSISELAYILDEKNLLRLCEYYGGQTIKIPTIDELEVLLYSMLLYQYIDVEKIDKKEAVGLLRQDEEKLKQIKDCYKNLSSVLSKYNITPRSSI